MASNGDVGKDVYDLLAWVQKPLEPELTGAGLGGDVGHFLDEIQDDEMPLSPEPNISYEKPTFEDYTEAIGVEISRTAGQRGGVKTGL